MPRGDNSGNGSGGQPGYKRAPVALVGATATGKSEIAMALARLDDSIELVSIDSMQVYRGMDIGTAKPSSVDQAEVTHHLIDLCDPAEEMSIVEFTEAYDRTLTDIRARGGEPLLVGGTGLYLRAVLDRLTPPRRYPDVVAELERETGTERLHAQLAVLDPVGAAKMEPTNRRRVIRALSVTIGSGRPFSSHGPGLDYYPPIAVRLVGIDVDRELLDERIRRRYESQMEAGFLEEVRALAGAPRGFGRTARQALGYKELLSHLGGAVSLEQAIDEAATRTRRFARRQQRWFRRDPRIEWITHDGNTGAAVAQIVSGFYEKLPAP